MDNSPIFPTSDSGERMFSLTMHAENRWLAREVDPSTGDRLGGVYWGTADNDTALVEQLLVQLKGGAPVGDPPEGDPIKVSSIHADTTVLLSRWLDAQV